MIGCGKEGLYILLHTSDDELESSTRINGLCHCGRGQAFKNQRDTANSEYEVYEEAFAGGEGKGKKLGGIGTRS